MAALENVESVPAVQLLRTFANNYGVTVVGGSVLLAAGNRVINTCLVLGPHGTLLVRYDKVHLFDIALDKDHSFQGTRYVAPGRDPATFSAFGRRMGLSKCYYLRFPELYRELVMRGAEVLFVPSLFHGVPARTIGLRCCAPEPLRTCATSSCLRRRGDMMRTAKAWLRHEY